MKFSLIKKCFRKKLYRVAIMLQTVLNFFDKISFLFCQCFIKYTSEYKWNEFSPENLIKNIKH